VGALTEAVYNFALSAPRRAQRAHTVKGVGLDEEAARQAVQLPACTGQHDLREVCHDLRQTIAAVQTLADAALADHGLQGVARAHVEKIVGQAEILSDTIRQQLRLAADGRKQRRLFNLRRLIWDLADAERVTYQGRLDVIAEPGPVLIHADLDDVRRVLANLLSNGTRAAGPAGSVVIEVTAESGLAKVVIDNTVPTNGQAPEGTGLGWNIITQRLSRIEGSLVYGQGRRGGVRATLRLPLAMYGPQEAAECD
jgi:signal transduction histidine kinase